MSVGGGGGGSAFLAPTIMQTRRGSLHSLFHSDFGGGVFVCMHIVMMLCKYPPVVLISMRYHNTVDQGGLIWGASSL